MSEKIEDIADSVENAAKKFAEAYREWCDLAEPLDKLGAKREAAYKEWRMWQNRLQELTKP